jgi:hypothetical protein
LAAAYEASPGDAKKFVIALKSSRNAVYGPYATLVYVPLGDDAVALIVITNE